MAKRERVKRPRLKRSDTPSDPDPGATASRDAERAPRAGDRPAPDLRDASYDAVNSAYRVIDEYMRQGQRLAEEFWMPQSQTNGASSDVSRMLDRFLRSAGDMGTAWLEMLSVGLSPNGSEAASQRTAGPFRVGDRQPGGAKESPGVAFTIAIQSKRPVRVTINAPVGLAERDVSPLMSPDRKLPPITGVRVESDPAEERPMLRVVVPPKQPPGRYHGLVLDADSGSPVGSLTVVVE